MMRERKTPIISANDRTAIFRAAAELELYANELRIAHTMDGQWGDERDARRDHDRLLRLAARLRRLHRYSDPRVRA